MIELYPYFQYILFFMFVKFFFAFFWEKRNYFKIKRAIGAYVLR